MTAVPAIIHPAELARIQTAYPLLDVDPLTSQEEQFVLFKSRGLSPVVAARAAGYTPQQGAELMTEPNIIAMIDYMAAVNNREVSITKDMLNVMLLEAHRKSATSTEEIMAVRELGKINDLYPTEKRRLEIAPAPENVTKKQIESMTDAQLMALTGVVIDLPDADFEEVNDDGAA